MPRKKITEAVLDVASDTRKRATKAKLAVKLGSMFKPLERADSNVTEAISSGIEVLDRYVIGIGGWPVKRISELFSDPGAGKTSLAFSALAHAQRAGGLAILIETEDALQVARARVFGCNLETVYLSEPASFEEVIEAMREGLSSIPEGMGPNLMAWDSIAMSILQDVIDKGLASKSVGKKAKHMSEQLPAVAKLCKATRTSLLLVNQTRQKIGVVFGNPTTTPGGETHKFASSVRLQLWAGKKVKIGDRVVGVDTTVVAMKNRLTIPNKKAKIRLLFESGWDDHWTTLNHAKELRVVDKGLKLTEANYQAARAALGWEGEGTPFTKPVVDVEDSGPALVAGDDEDEDW